jgi:hypothetical protein
MTFSLLGLGFFPLAFVAFLAIAYWRVLEKADLPGWGMFIPFYNLYLFFKMAGKSGWSMFIMLIPVVNFFFLLHTKVEIAKKFGKPGIFGLGMMFMPFLFYPILGFGDAAYRHESRYYREEELITEIGEDGEVVEKIEVGPGGQW